MPVYYIRYLFRSDEDVCINIAYRVARNINAFAVSPSSFIDLDSIIYTRHGTSETWYYSECN